MFRPGKSALIALILLCAFAAMAAFAQAATAAAWPGRAEAVGSDWSAQTPPESGWVDVTLPDDWSVRWPTFDGVVWYRLTWNVPAPLGSAGLFVEYLDMAATISINGVEIARDASLVEPLTRMWNTPRFLLLPVPLLHVGENTLLFRISGLAAYQPGLGSVRVGAPAVMHELYEQQRWLRRDLTLYTTAIGVTLGSFFLVLWLLRRQEVAYGWYGAQQMVWLIIAWNSITTSTQPFPGTDSFEAVQTAALLVFEACYAMFVLRFCERRWPRREAALWILTVLGCVWVLLTPHADMRGVRDLLTLGAELISIGVNLIFVYIAWRHGRTDQRVLSVCAMLATFAGTHDTLVFLRVIESNTYYATLTEQVTVVGVALVLGWNFVRSLRRIEGFNAELVRNVESARAELATTLHRQHDLELVHARLGERVNLAHDLHDGLGGMLIGNIAALEQADDNMPSREVLGMFKELRDDLRLIIDTASAQHYGEHSLAELLAPLRHRMTRLFEAHDIDSRWRVGNLEKIYLTTTQSLDLLRILQEALTNVLKHSGARCVEVDLLNDREALLLEVRDNGVGMKTRDETGFGTGMRSMQARARRLDASLTIGSQAEGTVVRLHRPWSTKSELLSAAAPSHAAPVTL